MATCCIELLITKCAELLFCLASVWYYFGMVGSFTFIVIQLILLVDFVHSWNQSWLEKAENGNSKCWYAGRFKQHG